MTTIADVLHTMANAIPFPAGQQREQLHADIDAATAPAPTEEPTAAVMDLQKTDATAAPATTAYGPGELPTIQGGPYAAPVAQGSPVPAFPGQVG